MDIVLFQWIQRSKGLTIYDNHGVCTLKLLGSLWNAQLFSYMDDF